MNDTEIQEDFFAERTRILGYLAQAENKRVIMRLIGALAFRTHCPNYGYIQDSLGRVFTDIDFASYNRFAGEIQRILAALGYEEDKMVTRLFGDTRMLFHDPKYGRHIDIFFDNLDFCHVLPLAGRLEAEPLTLPLAELMIEKMQIVQLNEKDVIDTIMLIREHSIGDSDDETINARRIGDLVSKDWGLWRTLTANLEIVRRKLGEYPQLSAEDVSVVTGRLQDLRQRIDNHPKTLNWKTRSLVGDRVKWYKDVEELENR